MSAVLWSAAFIVCVILGWCILSMGAFLMGYWGHRGVQAARREEARRG